MNAECEMLFNKKYARRHAADKEGVRGVREAVGRMFNKHTERATDVLAKMQADQRAKALKEIEEILHNHLRKLDKTDQC